MSEKRQAVTILWNEFMRVFIPKIEKLSPDKRLVYARLLKATLERYIETNDKK